ncbi:MAG TPA: RNA-binding protein [Gammaproteobacteria bacterium]
MDVFIGHLSPRTSLSDLVAFFKSFASDTRFQILDKEFEDGSRTRFAIATIESDKLAEKAIKKLNGQFLNGSAVVLREFLHRNYGNERRAVGWRDKPWHGVERRDLERRRKQIQKPVDFDTAMGIKKGANEEEEIDLQKIKIEARSQFSRKL